MNRQAKNCSYVPLDDHKGFGGAKFKKPKIAQSTDTKAQQLNTGCPIIANMNGKTNDFP